MHVTVTEVALAILILAVAWTAYDELRKARRVIDEDAAERARLARERDDPPASVAWPPVPPSAGQLDEWADEWERRWKL